MDDNPKSIVISFSEYKAMTHAESKQAEDRMHRTSTNPIPTVYLPVGDKS